MCEVDVIEQWRDVPGYPHLQVSNLGNARSKTRKVRSGRGYRVQKGQGLRQFNVAKKKRGQQYLAVQHGKSAVTVHKLVALAFCHGYKEGLHVNHINGDKTDNRSCNLEWVTASENNGHSAHHGFHQRGEEAHKAKLTESKVRRIRQLRKQGATYKELVEMFGVHKGSIQHIISCRNWKHVE